MAFLWMLLLSMIACSTLEPSGWNSSLSASDLASRSCIADLCIFPERLFIKQVASEYGGSKDANELCYRIGENALFMRIKAFDHPPEAHGIVESIELERSCNCSKAIRPKKSFRTLLTSGGLGVGDSYKKAIRLYGNPQWIRAKDANAAKNLKLDSKVVRIEQSRWKESLHGHDFVLGYVPDYSTLNALFIYIDHEEVSAIEASVSE